MAGHRCPNRSFRKNCSEVGVIVTTFELTQLRSYQETPTFELARRPAWRLVRRGLFPVLAVALVIAWASPANAQTFGCTPAAVNPVVCENSKSGNPPSDWAISGSGDSTIQGFSTDISVNRGQTVSFKINTTAKAYTIGIFRMGYYQGNGARKITAISPSVTLPQAQPACLTNAAVGLVDCGNWAVSASWAVPPDATSGLYFAVLTRADTGGVSQIFFVVRDDSSHSDMLYQTADETWAAYNDYGGHSLYGGAGTFDLPNRAFKVSYNRPSDTRSFEAATFLFTAEYPMIRWMEANGYDLSYFTHVDGVRSPAIYANHKVLVTAGHDEYWTGPLRANVEAARNAGMHMAFFSGNEVFWKTRWENAIDGSNTPYRTLVCYKETLSGGPADPLDPPTWTGTWRDLSKSPPADGGRPENSLNGTIFAVNGPGSDNTGLSIKVPAADGKMRFWRNTAYANQAANATATLPSGTLGYEWDIDADNGFRPAGLFDLSTATYTLTSDLLLDYGGVYGAGTATHHLTTYRAASGALVFGAGTVQWSWGLDANHDASTSPAPAVDVNMQQATVNLFADMGIQPGSLQAGLLLASKSTDTTPPVSTITSPANGATLQLGVPVTLTGTATDSGGVVGAVEVSVDGGTTWHLATGRASWTYSWTPVKGGTFNLLSRAVDDTANLETPGAGITVNVPKPPINNDATVSADGSSLSTTIASPVFSTSAGNELILAFISADYLSGANTTVTGVSGGGLAWTLVLRTNVQSGTSEIWRAFASAPLSNITVSATFSQPVFSSITLMSFTGVDTSGTNGSGAIGATKGASANPGAPSATLVTTRNSSLVVGVGNDYDNAIPRTVGTNQTLVHQDLTSSGDTYWVQMQTVPAALSGTSVTINDTAPTGDRYNLSIAEILANPVTGPTFSLSGTITGSGGNGSLVTLSGAASTSLVADASGNFGFANLANGTYTVTPSKTGFTFSPISQTVTVNGANLTGVNFASAVIPTFSVSGTVSGAVASGVAVALAGAASATTTTDASGNYSFANLQNGSYTVTPGKSGFTFTPANQPATVNGANVPGVNFTSTAIPTFTISGTISGPAASGAAVALSGAATASTTTDAGGNYSFSGLVNASYTVTPSKSGFTFTPANQGVTINGANVPAVNFSSQSVPVPATLATDVKIFKDGASASSTIVSPAFSTIAGNELLLAFVSADYLGGANTTVTGMTGGGLTWALVVRSNGQNGTAEIWRAFATAPLTNVTVTTTLSQSVISSIAVVSFTGADATGTNGSGAIGATKSASAASGAPTASLVTTRNASWVFGAGTDFDNAIARTVGTSQSLVHQYLTPAGDTYWAQQQNATTPLSGTTVTINDTAPTADRYNLAICEILPALAAPPPTFSISGNISGAGGNGASVALSGAATATATADVSGNFTFANLANGSYTVTPTKTGFTFTPASQAATISGANVTGVNFTSAAVPTFTISGAVSGAVASGVSVGLTGTSTATTTTDASGNYSFTGLQNGTYTVTPSKSGFTFSPVNQSVPVSGANVPGVNFTSAVIPTFAVSGTISGPAAVGATVALSGAATASTATDASGNYSFANLLNGSYTITPSNSGFTFTPASQAVAVAGANAPGVNFASATVPPPANLARDANVANNGPSAATTITSPAFSTTSNNEVLIAFIAADYLSGANTTVTGITGGGLTWTLVLRTNVQSGTAEVWRALAPTPLTNATITATLSQSVISSISVMSFTGADSTGTNASGAIGATKSANAASGAPTASLVTTRNGSWVMGVGSDYDNAIARTAGAGQTVTNQYLTPAGDTYWVQMQNSTTALSGTTVTINDTAPTGDRYNLSIVEILPASTGGGTATPPAVSMLAPASNAIAAFKTTLTATASDTSGTITSVQFKLDGGNLGSPLSSAPYELIWDTTTATSGSHTLTATAFSSSGLNTTSIPVTVSVDNSGTPSVAGSWSVVVNLPAVAVNLILLKNNKVLFYQDGATATVWDYTGNVFTNVPTSVNLFCSGHALLADGRVLVIGGYGGSSTTIGIANAEIFDPSNNTWTAVPNMGFRRWYPTATTLSDGRILVTAGWQTTNHTNAGIPEIYNVSTNSWTQLTAANNPFETYPFIYQLTDGRVIHVGGTEFATNTDILNLSTNTWATVDSRIIDGASSKMYLPGKIIKAGSASDSQNVGPSSNTAFTLDMSQATPAWQQVPSMAYPRSYMNLTELPDGSVLATGGETDKNGGTIANAVYNAELWSPQTQTWTTLSPMHTPREYHGTALLLPDGRVLVSGMGADFGQVPDENNAEFFSPPYLFKGARPSITSSPATVAYGSSFFVGTPDGASITKAVLIRTGAVTHFFDENTRYVPLTFTQTTGGLTLTAPANGFAAPPGYYMLFLVNSAGVPSVAPFLQLQ